MEVTWPVFKAFLDDRELSAQWIDVNDHYYMKAFDGPFELSCTIYKLSPEGDSLTEFEASYKDAGNKPYRGNVQTVFETNDKTLKMASDRVDFDVNGEAVLIFKVPGVPGTSDGRHIAEGMAWTVEQHQDDRVERVDIVDVDDLLGYGVGTVVRSYHDEEIEEGQKGWRIPYKRGFAEVETIGGYGFIPAGLYLRIKFLRGNVLLPGTAYCNLEWGKTEL